MARTIEEWNRYLSHVRDLRDLIKEGTKSTKGLDVRLSMNDCDTLWRILSDEVDRVSNSPLEYKQK